MQAFFRLKPVSLIEEIIRSRNLDNLSRRMPLKEGQKVNKGKTKFGIFLSIPGCQFTDLRADPAEISLSSLSKLCAVFASWTPPALVELWPWSCVVLRPCRLLALAEWMWTCSAALFLWLKT